MAMSPLRKLAAAAPVPVFPAIGEDAAVRIDDLALAPDVDLTATPRHAGVLLVAGDLRSPDREALCRVHDQLPHPRATLWWGAEASAGTREPVVLAAADDPRPALHEVHRRLLARERVSEPDLLPDQPPNPWRGRGDFGQGGEGMMGGTPYGRPMPMPPQADLRDGLMLDAYTATLGPFLPSLPPGLALEVTWQGDVVQDAQVIRPPLPPPASTAAPFHRALAEPVAIAELERARAAHHLRAVARVLDLLELERLARRCRRAARGVAGGEAVDLAALPGALRRAGTFAAIPPGLGRLPGDVAADLGGVPLRASGQAVDARAGQAEYGPLGFEATTQADGDARARLEQWVAEAGQSMRLAERARTAAPVRFADAVESPWGTLAATGRHEPARAALDFTDLLIGLEWAEAMLVIASFDVASLGRMVPREPDIPPGTSG